jgi:hypothetical protein
MTASIGLGIIAVIMFFFLVPEPEQIGIKVEEFEDDEHIVEAIETGVVDEVLKKSTLTLSRKGSRVEDNRAGSAFHHKDSKVDNEVVQ